MSSLSDIRLAALEAAFGFLKDAVDDVAPSWREGLAVRAEIAEMEFASRDEVLNAPNSEELRQEFVNSLIQLLEP